MRELKFYFSPIGALTAEFEDGFLVGLSFGRNGEETDLTEPNESVYERTREWLDEYFSGRKPEFDLPIKLSGTPFRNMVWERLKSIKYGQTVTYGEIAEEAARLSGKSKMSAQAVGGAVGKNPIAIIVPCHRVLGKNGKITGYAGGVDKKAELLKIEGIDFVF